MPVLLRTKGARHADHMRSSCLIGASGDRSASFSTSEMADSSSWMNRCRSTPVTLSRVTPRYVRRS